MRRILVLCAAVLVCGAVFGNDYQFTGVKFNESSSAYANWDNALNWTPTLVGKGNTSDSFLLALDCSTTKRVLMPNQQALPGNTKYFGKIAVTGGALVYQTTNTMAPALNIWRIQADNGQDGSFSISGANSKIMDLSWNQKLTIDVDGNINFQPGAWGSQGEGFYFRMRGLPTGTNDRTFSINAANRTGSHWAGYLQVDCGVRNLSIVAPTSGYNAANQVILNNTGTVTGLIYTMFQANAYSLYVAPYTDATQLDAHVVSSNFGGSTVSGDSWVSGKHYRDFAMSAEDDYFLGNKIFNLHIAGGDMWVRSFTVNSGGSNMNNGGTLAFDTDNNGIDRNLRVDGNAQFGPSYKAQGQSNIYTIFKANSSTVNVGRDMIFTQSTSTNRIHNAYMTAANAQIHVGRNFSVDNGSAAIQDGWNVGTSTFYFDNAFGAAQKITSGTAATAGAKSVPFYHVVINNPGGAVTLGDNMVLKGNFRMQAGVFRTGANYLVFQGGQGTDATAETLQVDNATGSVGRLRVATGSPTWVKLLSDLKITDNLVIDCGCELLLNGHTLTVTGGLDQGTYSGSGSWTVRAGGMIVGAAGVPEPATLLLMGSGLLAGIGYVRRRRIQ